MEKNNLEIYVENLYPFVKENDIDGKYINSLMAVRRTAFVEGLEHAVKFLEKGDELYK